MSRITIQKKELGIKFYLQISSTTSLRNSQPFKEVLKRFDNKNITWSEGRMVNVHVDEDVQGVERALIITVNKNLTQMKISFDDLKELAEKLKKAVSTLLQLQVIAVKAVEITTTEKSGNTHNVQAKAS